MKSISNKQKIIKAAEAMRIVLIGSLIFWSFCFGACLMPWFVVVPHMERLWPLQAYVYSGVVVQPLLAIMATIYGVFFFNRLKAGFLFDAKTVIYLSATGKWWFGYWLYEIAFLGGRKLLFDVAMNWDPACLIGALTVIVIAWFFREAQKLQEEQELTV